MGLAPNFPTVFVGDSIGCEVPDPIFSQPLCVKASDYDFVQFVVVFGSTSDDIARHRRKP